MFAECANLGCLVAFHWGLSPQTPRQGGLRPPAPPYVLVVRFLRIWCVPAFLRLRSAVCVVILAVPRFVVLITDFAVWCCRWPHLGSVWLVNREADQGQRLVVVGFVAWPPRSILV
jgi:hypothetical protein